MKIFLDTNVILDVLNESREHHVDSATILNLGREGYEEIVVSSQSILDAYYVYTVSGKHPLEELKSFLKELLPVVKVSSISGDNLKEAILGSNNDLEDAAQIACAGSYGCACIISSDEKMKRDSPIKVYTPKEFCDQVFGPWH